MIGEIHVNAMERKLAEEELVLRAHLAELGKEIGEGLTKGGTLQNILQRCAESIVQNLDAALARIWTFNQREKVLELQASAGMYTHINGYHGRIPVGMYKIGRIAQERKPHLTNEVIGDPEVHDQEWAGREKLVSFAGYPLVVENRLVGVMAMFARHSLTDYTLIALASVADNIAIGIERKRADEEKERLLKAIDKSTEGITIADENDRYIYVNEALARTFGYSQDEFIGDTWRKIIPHDALIEKEIPGLIHNRNIGTFSGEVPGVRKDGSVIPTEIKGTGFWDENNNYQGHVSVIRDISERRRMEDALLESEKRYRMIIEYSNDMIWTLDMEGRFLFFNKRSEEISGYRLEDWRGKSFAPLIDKKDLPKVIELFHKTLSGQPQQYEVSVIREDGGTFILSVNTAPIYSKGEIVGTVSFGRDITENKKAEEQIRKSLKEKEVLLSEIYHRVKNNMQIITSLLRLQSRYIKKEEDREIFKECQRRIMSMSLVHEKLYQSKDLVRIDFKEYIMDMSKGLLQAYGADRGKIALNIDVEDISLNIDSAIPCGLIINELVTNSLKYAFPDRKTGEIKIALRSTDENMIELVVGDNGIGIPEDIDIKRTRSLGLHLVTMLAENQLHGEISLNRSNGTEFKIKFKEVK